MKKKLTHWEAVKMVFRPYHYADYGGDTWVSIILRYFLMLSVLLFVLAAGGGMMLVLYAPLRFVVELSR